MFVFLFHTREYLNILLTIAMSENELSYFIINKAIEVHSRLGPGLLESAYQECLYYALVKKGFYVEKQKPMPLIFDEVKL